jgi:hypothetical protein
VRTTPGWPTPAGIRWEDTGVGRTNYQAGKAFTANPSWPDVN